MCELCIAAETAPPPSAPVELTSEEKVKASRLALEALLEAEGTPGDRHPGTGAGLASGVASGVWGDPASPMPRPGKGRKAPQGLVSDEALAGGVERVVRTNSVFKDLELTFTSDEEGGSGSVPSGSSGSDSDDDGSGGGAAKVQVVAKGGGGKKGRRG